MINSLVHWFYYTIINFTWWCERHFMTRFCIWKHLKLCCCQGMSQASQGNVPQCAHGNHGDKNNTIPLHMFCTECVVTCQSLVGSKQCFNFTQTTMDFHKKFCYKRDLAQPFSHPVVSQPSRQTQKTNLCIFTTFTDNLGSRFLNNIIIHFWNKDKSCFFWINC